MEAYCLEPVFFVFPVNQWMHVKIWIASRDPLEILWKDVELVLENKN